MATPHVSGVLGLLLAKEGRMPHSVMRERLTMTGVPVAGLRSKTQTASELDKIPGIGEKTKNELIAHFKSVKRIKTAEFSDIENIIGTHRASKVYSHFNPNLKA